MPGPIPYAQFYSALQKRFPGRFTQGPTQTMNDLLADFPELDDLLDPTTKGSEVLVGPEGPAMKPQAVGGVSGLPKPETYDIARGTPGRYRDPSFVEQAALLGTRVVPAVGGAILGGPGGGAGGAIAGEGLAELYEQATGLGDASGANIATQGAIGAIPVAKGLAKVPGVGPLVTRAGESIAGRIGLGAAEGVVQGGLSTEADIRLRQDRPPTMGERAFGAVGGAAFGAAGTGALEGVQAVRSIRAQGRLRFDQRLTIDAKMGGIEEEAALGQLSAPRRKAILAELEPLLPHLVDQQHAQATVDRLSNLFGQAHQDDLRAMSVAFVDYFQKQSPTLGLHERMLEVQNFVHGLRAAAADAETIDETVKILAALTPGNEPAFKPGLPPASDTATGARQGPFYGAPPEGPPFINRPDSELPLGRTLEPPPQTPDPRVEELGYGMEGALNEPPGPPRLIRRPEEARAARPGAGLLRPEFQPPAPIQPSLRLRGKVKDVAAPDEPPDFGSQPDQLGMRREGVVETGPRVVKGEIDADRAFLLHWLASDLEQGRPEGEQGGAGTPDLTNVHKEDEAQAWIDHKKSHAGYTNPGTDTLWGLQALGAKEDRPVIAQRIRDYLAGKGRKPTKSVAAALQMVDAWHAAYDPQTGEFDWSKVTTPLPQAKNLHGEPVGGYKPRILADMAFDEPTWGTEPRWLVEKYAPHYLAPEEQLPRFSHEYGQPPPEVQEMFDRMLADDTDLLEFYEDAVKYGDVEATAVGWTMHEIERRGLRSFRQPGLDTEGPGSPARRSLPREIAEQEPGLFDAPLPEIATPELGPPGYALTPEVAGSKGVQPGLFSDEPPTFGQKAPPTAKRPSLFDERGAVGTGPTAAKATRKLTFQNQAFDEIRTIAKAGAGREVAGVLLGRPDGGVVRVVPMRNIADDPSSTFHLDPVELAKVLKGARSEGLELLASYHTQPTGSAEPSVADRTGSVADVPAVIMGMDGGDIRAMKIWQPSGRLTGTGKGWAEGSLGVATLRDPNTPPVFQDIKDVAHFVRAVPRLRASANDAVGIGHWLEKNRDQYTGESWFVDTEKLLADGQTTQAWVKIQSVALMGERAARAGSRRLPDPTQSAQAVGLVDTLVRGGAQDPVGALFALFDGRTINVKGVGRMVVGPEIPPNLHGTAVFTGPGGVIRPGDRKNKLVGRLTDGTLATEISKKVLEGIDAPAILRDPTRAVPLFRQVGEQMLLTPANFKAVKALVESGEMTVEEVAQHWSHGISESARQLGALGNWAQKNAAEIRTIEGIKGASGEVDDLIIKGKGGRVIGRLGDLTADQTFDNLVKPTRAWDRVALLNDLSKSKATGTFTLVDQASRGFMLSQFATMMRNLEAAGLRWSTEMVDLGGEAVAHALSGNTGGAKAAWLRAAERAKIPYRMKADHTWVSPLSARKEEFDAILESVRGSSGDILKLADEIQPEGVHLLGSVAFGEPTPHGRSKYGIVNDLISPKVQNTLGMFNRAQEFTVRSSIYVAEMRASYRLHDIDPDKLSGMSAGAIAEQVGGMDALQAIHHNAVSQAMDFSFSGELDDQSMAKWVIDFLHKPIKGGARPGTLFLAGYPFPRFNLSAAPRFIWDHSGLMGLTGELVRANTTGGGRYALGKRATGYEAIEIPEMNRKISEQQRLMGDALMGGLELGRRKQTYVKMVNRAERQLSALSKDPTLPGVDMKVKDASRNLDLLRAERNAITGRLEKLQVAQKLAESNVKDLTAQRQSLLDVVKQARETNAPRSLEQLMARQIGGGGAMLGAAYLIRSMDGNENTPWYTVRVDKPAWLGGMPDEHIELDMRPFAPFAQYLFVADAMQDLYKYTDWTAVSQDLESGTAGDLMDAVYDHYEGKYTKASFGKELGQAFLSMSQAAGTTLALVDAFTEIPTQGVPSPTDFGEKAARVLGSYVARFTIPFAQFKSVSDLASDQESMARIAKGSASEGTLTRMAMPLMQYAGNLPFLGAMLIPETVNQITGKPLDTYAPLVRALTGITARERTGLQDMLTEAGVAPASIYLRDTGDPFLDRLLGFHYANTLGRVLPQILEDPEFARLTTPAQRRDFLAQLLPQLKASAIGEAMQNSDPEQLQAARETREGKRRRLRMQRLESLIEQEGLKPAETTDDTPPTEPELQEPAADEPPAFEGSSVAGPPGF